LRIAHRQLVFAPPKGDEHGRIRSGNLFNKVI
jgi:hypothetical protein